MSAAPGLRSRLPGFTPVAFWLAVILVSGLALYGTRPPAARSGSAPSNFFSAARARTHLEQIAKRPHPIGSDDAIRVRDYLIGQLRSLGGEVHVEESIGTAHYGRTLHSGRVSNVVATFPGHSSSHAVMLVAHYDSVPEGPGAGDDGAGVAVILEAIRAIRTGPGVKNDLIVLFTDGEEARGLLGALAFVAGHPDLANRIGIMVNLEARGGSGPALMFETSDDNGALIREFGNAAPYPMATSLMAAIYKLLPNDTDFTPLKAVGVQGLNIAFIETYQNYHTRLDTIENLDPRSVQHMGANVLGIIERFGNLNQSPPKEPDLVYFNWFGSWLVVYPVWLAWAAAVLAPVLFVIFCLRSAGRSYLTFGRTVAGFGMFFLQLLLLLIGSFAAFAIAKLIAGEFQPGDTRSNQFLFCGVMGIGLGLAVASQRFLRDKVGLVNLHAGQLLAVSLVTLVVCWFLIGGSYVLQWPLLFAMAGMLLSFRLTKPASLICQCVFAIAALLILVPLAYMFFVALTFTYVAVGAAALLLALLLALAPALFDQLAGNSKLALIFLFLVSIVLIGSGIRLCGWSAAHPRADTLIYSLNTDENKAKWVSYDAAPDAWTASVLGSTPRKQSDPAYTAGLNRPVFASDAAVVSLESPAVAMTQNFVSEGQQTMTLQIKSRRDARSVIVRLPADLKLSGAGWNGQVEPIHNELQANVPWTFRFFNAPPEGVSFMLRFPAQNRVHVLVGDTTPGLPTIEPLPPRPADTTPGYGSDITLVAGAHEF